MARVRDWPSTAQEATPLFIDAQLVGRTIWVLCLPKEVLNWYPGCKSGWCKGEVIQHYSPAEAQQIKMDLGLHWDFNVRFESEAPLHQIIMYLGMLGEVPMQNMHAGRTGGDGKWQAFLWLDLNYYDPYEYRIPGVDPWSVPDVEVEP